MENYEIIYNELNEKFPEHKCELMYNDDPFQLLIAVILSAQCTDKRVNQVTPALFEKYPTVYEMKDANQLDVQEIIHSCGFFVNKAKNIINCAKDIVEKFNGQVPNRLEDLVTLSGVGRKTANVVLSTCFNTPAIAVDTHVFRVSNRLGLSNSDNVELCEKQLMECLPKEMWSAMHYLLVLFGRYYCKAKNPSCDECGLKGVCKEYQCRRK